ncbi:MAG: low specificity L-threonine aldolase [Calditrichaceae bacterium]|nr:low specificity L-threonine aldolase [Calditrichaceae bacterium]
MKYNKNFASDNNAGVHPEIMKALQEANRGHVVGYGDDPYTKKAEDIFRKHFGADAQVFFTYGGTGANVIGLQSILHSHQAVICAETAHINVDECGAPEHFTGCKLIPLPTADGKLRVEQMPPLMHSKGFEHHVQPGVISVSQPTEMGAVYTVEELQDLSYFARENDLFFHMDGARIANAAVFLDKPFHEFTADSGVDVLSFGGTKNGMMFGEAVVFFDEKLSEHFKYIRKQGMQLHSKMRFISAQFNALLENDLWQRNALHANRMAKLLEEKVKDIRQIKITQPVQTNAIFAQIPHEYMAPLQKEYFFYIWNAQTDEVRWMTSFDTEEEDVEVFVSVLRRLI